MRLETARYAYLEQLKTTFRTNRITLRLPNSILDELRKEAEDKDLALNSFISKILVKHISFNKRFEMMPTVLVSQVLLAAMVENMDESAMSEAAKLAPKVVKKLAALGGWEYNIDKIIENYFTIISKYCGWYQFRYKEERANYTLIFETNMGRKWARFILKYVRSILESLKVHITDESLDEEVIVFKFLKLIVWEPSSSR
ncbi:MAG TPA: hypothetical protein VJ771_03540 [Candidatus Nitrosotalea sp.]|nr:hypothetical protein [Candidatus Nitrosotalea sp.]